MTHGGYVCFYQGVRFHTYHRMPEWWCCTQHLLALTPEADLFGTAVHEAGHLVADLVGGIHVRGVVITPHTTQCPLLGPVSIVPGHTEIGRVNASSTAYLIMLIAGEEAQLRWLAEAELLTSERAWAVERGALDDTAKAIDYLRDEYPDWDDDSLRMAYWQYRPAAQELLDTHWDRVMNIAGPLTARHQLGGDEAAKLANLPNPPEPDPEL